MSAAQTLRVRGVLTSMLWLTGISAPVCFAAAYAFRSDAALKWLLVFIGVLPSIVSCLGFGFFAWKRPEMLQSEEYQLRHEALQLVQAKSGPIAVDSTSLPAITNPTLPLLPSSTSGAE